MFNQHVGRTLDGRFPSECAQAAAYERRLACAELTGYRDHHSAAEPRSKARAGRFGRSGVRKSKRGGRHQRCRLRSMITSSAPASAASVDSDRDWQALAADIRRWGEELGFQQIGIADTDLDREEHRLLEWLRMGRHGAM